MHVVSHGLATPAPANPAVPPGQYLNCISTIYARKSLFLGPYQHICGLYTHPIIILFYICIVPHAPGSFYGDPRPRPRPRVRAPVVRPGACGPVLGRGRGRGPTRAPGPARGDAVPGPVPSKSYDDADVGNTLPGFNPSRPPGIHFGRPLLQNAMTRAVDFFFPFLYSRYDKHYM